MRRDQESRTGPSILIIVQNLPVPFDRRVWLECQALVEAGYRVAVICPKGEGEPGYEVLEGVHLYKYKPAPSASGLAGFVSEFGYSFAMTFWLSLRVVRRHGISVIQACNPPDTFWALALLYRFFGVKFVFDQHDLCPELYLSRFPGGSRVIHRVLLVLERMTYRTAHHVISTNDSYKRMALTRGRVPSHAVTIVRTGPDPEKLRRGRASVEHLRGFDHLAVYIGVMGPQDGVDIVLLAAAHLKHEMGRTDVGFTLIGSGDCYRELRRLAVDLAVEDVVHFTGRAPDKLVAELMSTASIGLSPDPKSPLNDVSTMNKTMEYMAFGLPVVAFELVETRVSAGEAAVYAEPNDVGAFAQAIVELLDAPDRRSAMGRLGRERVVRTLAWSNQRSAYLSVYDRVTGRAAENLRPRVTKAANGRSSAAAGRMPQPAPLLATLVGNGKSSEPTNYSVGADPIVDVAGS